MKVEKYVLYWIHNEFETNILTDGYVGISKDPARRLNEHKKKHIDWFTNRTFEIILMGDKEYCKHIEQILRPISNIGLNSAPGGGKPPNVTGIKRSTETRKLLSENNVGMKGKKHTDISKTKMSLAHKGQLAWNKGITHLCSRYAQA